MKKTIDFAMVLDFSNGRGSRTRTYACGIQNPVPYQLGDAPMSYRQNSIAAEVSDVKKKFGFLQNYFASAKYGSVSR